MADFTARTDTNIQRIRKAEIKKMSEALCVPYNQYDNKYNRDLLKAMITPMLNASIAGYQYCFQWRDQIGDEIDNCGDRLFKIHRNFLDIVLNDEKYRILLDYAESIRAVDTNNISSVADAIEMSLTDNFYIISQPKNIVYIFFLDEDLLKGLIYYKLIPTNVCSDTYIIRIPSKYKGRKIWWWATNQIGTTKFQMPRLGSYWLYNKATSPTTLSNPLIIMPEWIYKIQDEDI